MHIARRLEKIEGALMGNYIPKANRLQIIKGVMSGGIFVPDRAGDSVEKRKRDLVRRYGSAEGAVFVTLVDRFEAGREL